MGSIATLFCQADLRTTLNISSCLRYFTHLLTTIFSVNKCLLKRGQGGRYPEQIWWAHVRESKLILKISFPFDSQLYYDMHETNCTWILEADARTPSSVKDACFRHQCFFILSKFCKAEIGTELEKNFLQLLYSTVLTENLTRIVCGGVKGKWGSRHFISFSCVVIAMTHCWCKSRETGV